MVTITGFVVQDNQLFATASFIGSGIDPTGSLTTGVLQGILLPVKIRKVTQQILQLEVGPLRLELLEAHADLGRATLEITASPDPTGARRNLLDAIAHLGANSTAPMPQLVRLLNRLLTAFP